MTYSVLKLHLLYYTIYSEGKMLAKVSSFALGGLKGFSVEAEIDINPGVPSYETVGLAGTAVKESKERVRSALKNSGYEFPLRRITINLAPADVKKEGTFFDLAIAIGIMVASGQIQTTSHKDYVFIGALSLDGRVCKVNGLMPIMISAVQNGYTRFIIPAENGFEASFIEGAEVYPVSSLTDAVDFLKGDKLIAKLNQGKYETTVDKFSSLVDFCDVKGQASAKRALEIAVSGGHNALMIGPPGSGKTMLARCVPTIMPPMSFEEALEVTKIHSVAGALDPREGIVRQRPFRSPHHTATTVSLVGGGTDCHPGEISLAHNGVLFLDELPEYSRHTLETLRQPLEDGVITVSRAVGTVEYPAHFILIASMNPCPCGNYGSRTQICTCSDSAIRKYRAKLSGPLMDRIDLHIDVDSVSYQSLKDKSEQEKSESIKERVCKAREIQLERFKGTGVFTNARMTPAMINKYCALDKKCEDLMEKAFTKLRLSARANSRILKVARTIADLDGEKNILDKHILEAIKYRSLDRKYNE